MSALVSLFVLVLMLSFALFFDKSLFNRLEYWGIIVMIWYFLLNTCQYFEGKPLHIAVGMGDKNKFYQSVYFIISIAMLAFMIFMFFKLFIFKIGPEPYYIY
jgi:hypothetical protein